MADVCDVEAVVFLGACVVGSDVRTWSDGVRSYVVGVASADVVGATFASVAGVMSIVGVRVLFFCTGSAVPELEGRSWS